MQSFKTARNVVFRKGLFVLSTLYLAMTCNAALAQAGFSLDLKGQLLFKEEIKQLDEIEFITGEIVYREDEEDGEEGYEPKSSLIAQGPFVRRIYDHQESQSALEVLLYAKGKLKEQGFHVVFECEKQACGDLAAWQLYLSGDVNGTEDRQYYIIARKDTPDAKVQLVSVYVNEFTRKPRTIVDRISTNAFELGSIQVDGRTYAINDENRSMVQFAFNSAELSQENEQVLEHMLDGLDSSEALLVVGHTDNVGASTYNQTLSERRAKRVRDFILNRSVNASQIFIRGDGESAPIADNRDEAGRAKNRRTVVYRVSRMDS